MAQHYAHAAVTEKILRKGIGSASFELAAKDWQTLLVPTSSAPDQPDIPFGTVLLHLGIIDSRLTEGDNVFETESYASMTISARASTFVAPHARGLQHEAKQEKLKAKSKPHAE